MAIVKPPMTHPRATKDARKTNGVTYRKLLEDNSKKLEEWTDVIADKGFSFAHGEFQKWDANKQKNVVVNRRRFEKDVMIPLLQGSGHGVHLAKDVTDHVSGRLYPPTNVREWFLTNMRPPAYRIDRLNGKNLGDKYADTPIMPGFQAGKRAVIPDEEGNLRFVDCNPYIVYETHISEIHEEEVTECPPLFKKWLEEVFPNDPDQQLLFRQLCGVVVNPMFTPQQLQVVLYFSGVGGSGKSTAFNILKELVGKGSSYTVSDVARLGDRFTAQGYWNKQLLYLAELGKAEETLMYNARREAGLGVLKSITGNDSIEVERKGIDSFEAMPMCIPVGVSNYPLNNLLLDPQTAKAFGRRFIPLEFNYAIPLEDQDGDLIDKLRPEMPKFLRLCVQDSYEALNKHGRVSSGMFVETGPRRELKKLILELDKKRTTTSTEFFSKFFIVTHDRKDILLNSEIAKVCAEHNFSKIDISKILRGFELEPYRSSKKRGYYGVKRSNITELKVDSEIQESVEEFSLTDLNDTSWSSG